MQRKLQTLIKVFYVSILTCMLYLDVILHKQSVLHIDCGHPNIFAKLTGQIAIFRYFRR